VITGYETREQVLAILAALDAERPRSAEHAAEIKKQRKLFQAEADRFEAEEVERLEREHETRFSLREARRSDRMTKALSSRAENWSVPLRVAATLAERRSGTPQPLRRSFRPRLSLPERTAQVEGGGVAWFALPLRSRRLPPSGLRCDDASPADEDHEEASLSIRSDLREGRESGFPLCCRLRFALTDALRPGNEQAGARGVSRTETGIDTSPAGSDTRRRFTRRSPTRTASLFSTSSRDGKSRLHLRTCHPGRVETLRGLREAEPAHGGGAAGLRRSASAPISSGDRRVSLVRTLRRKRGSDGRPRHCDGHCDGQRRGSVGAAAGSLPQL
jgi:hypothetical protein